MAQAHADEAGHQLRWLAGQGPSTQQNTAQLALLLTPLVSARKVLVRMPLRHERATSHAPQRGDCSLLAPGGGGDGKQQQARRRAHKH